METEQGRTGWVTLWIAALAAVGIVGLASADEVQLTAAIAAATEAEPGWVLGAERVRHGGDVAMQVAVVTDDGTVQRLVVDLSSAAVVKQVAWGERADAHARKVQKACGGNPPDLAELARRVERMAQGCRVAEVEVELHRDSAVAEVECLRPGVEVELIFDVTDGRVIGLEVEGEGEEEEEEEDDEEGEELEDGSEDDD